ncbi:MAG TPA: beta-propeller fold lactonase family protein [Pseudonocardiaceae bacterium]|nr:beta-propeller fold lactonase family protein [Pseudonocardiaceae bacterium]
MTIRSTARHRKNKQLSWPRLGSRRRWLAMLVPVLAVATAVSVVGGVRSATAADNPNPTVVVGGDPQGVAVDADGKHVYVASYADNTVRVIDTATRQVTGNIRVGANPLGVGVDPDSRHAFVSNFSDNSVSVIDTAAGKVIKNIPVGQNPSNVTVFLRDHFAFVSNYYGNSLSVIDTRTLIVVGTVPVGSHPDGVAIDPRGEFAYVANSGSNSVSVVDIHKQKVVRAVLVGRAPQKVAIDPDGKHIYVTNFGDNSVSVINAPSQLGLNYVQSLLKLKVNNVIPVGLNPRGLAVDRDNHHAFVVNVGGDTLSTIDTEKSVVISTAYVGYSPDQVAVASDHTAYVTSRGDGTVTIIRPS